MTDQLDFEELEARVAAGESATANAFEALGREIVELKTLVVQLTEQEQAKSPRRWATYATTDEWEELAQWVDDLNSDYSLRGASRVPRCWPSHPGVVEELAALWSAWKSAAIAAQSKRRNGTADYIAWHDRWLWPTLRRLETNHYTITNCTQAHADEYAKDMSTDRDRIPRPAPAQTTATSEATPAPQQVIG